MTCPDNITKFELDCDSLLDGLFQHACVRARGRTFVAAYIAAHRFSVVDVLPAAASDNVTPLLVRVDSFLDRGGRPPCKSLDFEDLNWERERNFVMCDDSLDKAVTGNIFDLQRDTVLSTIGRSLGQNSYGRPCLPRRSCNPYSDAM